MRLLLFVCLLSSVLLFPRRSAASNDEALLRRVADKVLADYRTGYTDRATGRFYVSPDEIPAGTRVRFACKYMDWHYSLGVLDMAISSNGRSTAPFRLTGNSASRRAKTTNPTIFCVNSTSWTIAGLSAPQ